MSARSPLQISYMATFLILLGFSMMIVGGLYPTAFGKQVESGIRVTIIQISAPATVTLGIQLANGQQSLGHNAPEPTSVQINVGDTIVFGGTTNVANGMVTVVLTTSVSMSLTYMVDGSGYYGYKYVGSVQPILVQVKQDGLYVQGIRDVSASYGAGSTLTFKATIGSATSNTVTATIVSVNPPTATVRIQGCDDTIYSNVQPTDTIKTCSPVYVEATLTQQAASVTGFSLTWQGTSGTTGSGAQSLTKGTPPSGSTFPVDSSKYYGSLTLAAGTYEVHLTGSWTNNGQASTFTVLSIIGYFGVTEPVDMRWYWGVGVFIIGLVLAGSGFSLVASSTIIRRRRGGP